MLWKMTFVKFLKNFWETSTTAFIFINLQGIISSAIRQKWESLNGCFKKTKHAKFPEKRIFLPPWYALMFWDSPFCLITDKLFAIYVTFRLRNYGKKKIFGSTFWKRRFNIAMPTFVKFRLCLLWLSIQIWFTYCSLPIIFTTI